MGITKNNKEVSKVAFVHKITVSKKLTSENEVTVGNAIPLFYDSDGREVSMWHRSLPTLMNFYMQKIDTTILDDVDLIELHLSGDYGKNTYFFIDILLLRYKDNYKDAFILELKLGETNEEKDQIKHINELLKEISYTLDDTSTGKEE